jgi:hypothetical protein
VQTSLHRGKPLYRPVAAEPDDEEEVEIYFANHTWRISGPMDLFCEGLLGPCSGDSGGCCCCHGRIDYFENTSDSASPPTLGWQLVLESWRVLNPVSTGRLPPSAPSIVHL